MPRRVIISTKGDQKWQGIPAIERAANGRLWCAFFSGGPKEPHEENYILITSSSDDGETWDAPRRIVERPGATRVFDPALWHDPSGRLWLLFNQANQNEKDFSVWAMTTTESGSETPRWSAPGRLDLNAPYAFRLNKPTVTSRGSWLLPVTWARSAPKGWFFGGPEHVQGAAISTDSGKIWALHGAVEAPPWALENMFVERKDGSIWMLMRTGAGVIWQSVSTDGGLTWSKGTPTSLVNPGVRFFIRRLRSSRILLINTPNPKERTGLFAYLSEDDGATFGTGLELDDRQKVSYPDAVESPDGLIYAVHDRDRGGVGEILLDTFTEEDIIG